MQSHMSILEMFLQAGFVGRGVMIALALASVWCWAIILECLWSLRQFDQALAAKQNRLTPRLNSIYTMGQQQAARHIPHETAGERHARIIGAMKRRAQEEIELLQGGLSNLATIASVAPFVGLFGTVWGIMNSFTSIADAKDTSLAVVAPGIAEALAATAIGLAAAIPAAFAFNRLKTAFGVASRKLGREIEEEALTIEQRPYQAKGNAA